MVEKNEGKNKKEKGGVKGKNGNGGNNLRERKFWEIFWNKFGKIIGLMVKHLYKNYRQKKQLEENQDRDD